ncbi:MAG TPA: hypothetical protein VL242_13140, partial [Sorangium sp.]|nr:hypothetical protein [Sorangium sp.]
MTLAALREALRSALLDNLGLKLLSITFALCLYAFIHGAENAQRTFSLDIVTIIPPDSSNRQLMTQVPQAVSVTVRGSRTQLDDLRADDLGTLQLDLRNGTVTRIELDKSMFHVPAGLTVEQIYPPTIDLRWDDVVVRPIPVQVPRTGDAAQGFLVKGTTSRTCAAGSSVPTTRWPRGWASPIRERRSARAPSSSVRATPRS